MDIKEKYNKWLNSKIISKEDIDILKKMNEEEIIESFYSDLEFGTAGIRGIMGLGDSKINKYTIGKVTLGLARFINKHYKDATVVVAYDTRNNSKEFAKITCLVLNYFKIKTYLFDTYTSTPELAFAVKYLKCTNGIVITSSHNAKIYNGYKVYNSLGGQIIDEVKDISNEIKNVNSLDEVKLAKENNQYFNIVEKCVHDAFIKENLKAISNIELLNKYSKEIKVTYSSLHGVGLETAEELLNKFDFNYNIVKEQCTFDGNFPYAKEPNPEYIFNYDLAIKYAKENNSDLIILTDPDADRVGVMYKNKEEYKYINGNLLGIMFANYISLNSKENNNSYMVKSIVTTPMLNKICKEKNIECYEVLTGCKNIAHKKHELKNKKYLFGYEESLGYMFDINIDDKDGFSSMMVILEIMCYCKENNITMTDYITSIYEKYGYYLEETLSFVYSGIDGKNIINKYMDDLRNDLIIFDENYIKYDYLKEKGENYTNALKYTLNDESTIMIRPSGTEPKIKIYLSVNSNSMDECTKKIEKLKTKINNIFNK